MKTSIIVSTYNWPQALQICLGSILKQTVLPDEIVIADDGSTGETRRLVEEMQAKSNVPIEHVWHEDKGFRRTTIMNKAIARASGDYILQVDGDVILSPHFVSDHLELAEKNYFVCGSRVKLTPQNTQEILATSQFKLKYSSLPLTFLLNSFRSRLFRHLLAKVNGYNEDLAQWGHEDGELAYRLHFAGVKKKALKMGGNVYHLYHKEASKSNEQRHLDELEKVKRNHLAWCENGLNKHL